MLEFQFKYFIEKLNLSQKLCFFTVLYYQQLSIAHLQVMFYANNYFELLSIVSTAFKTLLSNVHVIIMLFYVFFLYLFIIIIRFSIYFFLLDIYYLLLVV